MKKVKISELPLYTSLKGLFTIGADSDNRSVKVSLEFIEEQTTDAVTKANTATAAANTATTNAKTATTAANTATANADTATANATSATERAEAATKAALDATAAAATATSDAKTATTNANAATTSATAAAKSANTAADTATKAATTATETAKTAADAAKATADTAAASAEKTASEAAAKAEAATAKTLDTIARLVPESMTIEAIERITIGNTASNSIVAQLYPETVLQNVIFISDNEAVKVSPNGRISVKAVGASEVHVIPTNNTSLAKTIRIQVTEPTMRLHAAQQMRFTASGAMRLN